LNSRLAYLSEISSQQEISWINELNKIKSEAAEVLGYRHDTDLGYVISRRMNSLQFAKNVLR